MQVVPTQCKPMSDSVFPVACSRIIIISQTRDLDTALTRAAVPVDLGVKSHATSPIGLFTEEDNLHLIKY